MSRFIICALGASPPGTMGGNTKITIEMARCLAGSMDVHVMLPQYKLPTFTDNISDVRQINFHPLPDFPGDEKFQPIACSRWYRPHVENLFKNLAVDADDIVFSCSDFHMDVLPVYALQRTFGFKWIPSVFLFIPFVFENLCKRYRFPVLKYIVYWFYQRALFFLMKRRATAFVVTNKSDFGRFPRRFRNKLFAYYGGVNVEQIPERRKREGQDARSRSTAEFKVVFCSRLHPQKGIDAFLDVWKEVISSARQPSTFNLQPHLTIIGNGEPAYETHLRDKAERLGISNTLTWLGYVNNEAKYRIYAAADLFVHPTVFDNNGMVAAEALCTGLPVVMQDLPALRDVYTTGCLKVPFADRAAFANAIVERATDPDKLAALAPTQDQVSALRAHWRWESRAEEFGKWLNQFSRTDR